jgi:carbamoyl-phosphate synthase small subunit
LPHTPRALLALADGTVFHGISIGARGSSVGEVVFNTALTGYQEILTDPSYCRQIVTLTYPQVGNVGMNPDDDESGLAVCGGLILREPPPAPSNWRSRESLSAWLERRGVVALAGIDTRRLTRILREHGAQNACIQAGDIDETAALASARGFAGLAGMDLAQSVSVSTPYLWQETSWTVPGASPRVFERQYSVVAYDFGVKRNILRMLADRGCAVTVVPARTPAAEVLAMRPDGVFLSNGPGDPEPCDYAIDAIGTILARKTLPVFGICLGHQLLALASGARTLKMKFGHHGANHPVSELDTGRVLITSQNHGFAVDETTLPATLRVTHRSLFDGTIQGLERTDCPAFCFQGHPEASPGPQDVSGLFDRFVALMRAAR